MKITQITHHISHNDLDGYGCQYITRKLNQDIIYKNINYDEIDDFIKNLDIKEGCTLLITDLNLKRDQALILDKLSREKDFNLLLIDHHITGQESADIFDWYNLDTSKCATALTYDYFKDYITDSDIIKSTVNLIDVYDMWRTEKVQEHRKGTLLSDVIFNTKLDSKHKNEFLCSMIDKIGMLFYNDYTVRQVEEKIPLMIANILYKLTESEEMKKIMTDFNICSSYKRAIFPATELEPFYKFQNIYFYTGINSSTFQYCSSFLLERNLSDKTLVNINSSNGNMSIRSRNKTATILAQRFGGGGHPDAGGARLELDPDLTLKQNINRILLKVQ